MQIQCQNQPNFNEETCYILPTTTNQVALKELPTEFGATLFYPFLPSQAGSALVINCGDLTKLDGRAYLKILHKVALALTPIKAKNVYCELTKLPVKDKSDAWKAFHAAHILGNKFYAFNQFKSDAKSKPIESLQFETTEDKALQQAQIMLTNLTLLKDLANLPANICTPTYLAETAQKITTLKTEILEEADMEKLGMNTLLSVSKGSTQPAKLIVMHHQGCTASQKPIVFVGKGVTFDSGGISLKPSIAMDEMKYDMCGAATVIALLKTAAELKLPLNIVGIVPTVENMPSGMATRPGDIVKSLSGKTVEILNTDAEGRLILCDALTYAEKFSPEIVIDLATLTGSAIMTFGNITNVVMGNDQDLINHLLKISDECGERSWQLPLWDEYQELLRSNFADLPNIHSDSNAKCIIAGCFLSRFTENYKWAHLDIAGTASIGGKNKGATGRPLMMLVSYLLSLV